MILKDSVPDGVAANPDLVAARVRHLRGLTRADRSTPQGKARLWNARGKFEEQAGDYAAAFACFETSRKARAGGYDAQAMDRLVAEQERVFGAGAVAGEGPAAPAPGDDAPQCIFVVGLPRSGTRLVAQILSRHPCVHAAGERAPLQQVLTGLRRRFPGRGGPWDWAGQVGPEDLGRARRAFHRLITPPEALRRSHVVLTMTRGPFDIGAARILLPSARFLFIARHPLDVGLSNFTHSDNEDPAFATSLDSLAHMTRAAYRSLEHYMAGIGPALRVQSYAGLVLDPQAHCRRMLEHVGLPWSDACLAPEQPGALPAASAGPWYGPITTDGLGKWERYDQQLIPLVDAMGLTWLEDWLIRDAIWAGQ